MQTLIAVDHVTFQYPAEQGARGRGLLDLSLEIAEGEFIAILGANGSGKTTLARHLNGLLLPDAGSVRVDGLDTRQKANLGLIRQKVGMVFQHPEEQIVSSTVEEDVAFGPENLGLEPAQIRRRVDEAIGAVGLEAHRFRPPHLLSAGQMQRLALAGVLAMRPRCVVFDEATTMLDPGGRRMALDLMARLRAEGLTVVFITHDMEEAARAARVIVLREGRVAMDGAPQAVFASPNLADWGLELPPALALARQMGISAPILRIEELLAVLPAWNGALCRGVPAHSGADRAWEAVIAVAGLEHIYLRDTPLAHTALVDVSLEVLNGRAHGLAGVTGSGKSTLLQHLNGLLRPQRGQVRVGPFDLAVPQTRTQDVVKLVGLVFQNPENQFFETYSGDEIAYGPRRLGLDGSLRARVRTAMERVGLDFEVFKDRPTFSLSGGEQRKVALASVLAIEPRILLLDEPTAGLDPRSHQEVLRSLVGLQGDGVEMVVSSHRMDDLAVLARDLSVFRKGRTLRSAACEAIFTDADFLDEAGLEPPVAVRAAARLRELGWPIDRTVVTAAGLAQAMARAEDGPA